MRKKLVIFAMSIALGAISTPACAEEVIQAKEPNAIAALGREQADRGQFKEAESSYRKALSIDPLNSDALSGLIALYRQQGMLAKVQLTIAQLTPAQRSALGASLKRIESTMLQDQADSRLAKGQDDQAIKYLEQAVQVDIDDPWLHFKLAKQYAHRGSPVMGLTLLDDFLTRHPNDSDALYALAQYQSEQGDTGNALKTLSRIEVAKRSREMALLQQRLAIKNLLQETKSLMQSGKKDDAIKMLSEAEAISSGNDELTLAVALAWVEISEVKQGRTLFDQVNASKLPPLKLNKLDREARRSLIEILIVSGKRSQALQQLDEWASDSTANDISAGLQLSGMFFDLGEYGRAKKLVDSLIAAHPEAAYVLYDAWKMAQRAGRLDHEIDYLKKLVVAEPYIRPGSSRNTISPQNGSQQKAVLAYESIGIDEFGSPDKIQRDWKEKKLAALIDRRSDWFSSAIDVRSRSGTVGVSQYNSVEIPLEYKTPWHTNDEVFFRTDLVKLSAGNVDPTNDRFGSLLLCQPTCATTMLRQATQGMSFTAGYQRGDLSADMGFTPLNFPVANVVGAIRQKGDLGQFGYSVEASRRPVTGSFLSFAGTKDPNTGKAWGGVVATGGRFGLSLDKGETFGFWSSFGWHSLTGRNVLSNRRIQVMAGEQWRMINEENRLFSLGLAGMYWHFKENAGEYTFGHGGYYCPQYYRSLSLPITYAARSPRFSYLLRGAVSASRTQMQDAQFYPTDSAMQAQAALAPVTPIYTGGPSKGTGYSLKAAWEYQVEPKLFAGGLLSIDRSDFYAPNRALIYLRYSFDHSGAQPVFMPPEPMEPSSQF